MASSRLPFVYFALIGLIASGYATLSKSLDPKPNAEPGDDAGSETELAADMAELFASQAPLRLAPVPGDSGLQNISRLLNDPHIDAGFVSTDVLADAKTQSAVPNRSGSSSVKSASGPRSEGSIVQAVHRVAAR
jgi:hypothetical protein